MVDKGTSPDYLLLKQVFTDAKRRLLFPFVQKLKYPRKSKKILKLQKQFYAAIRRMIQDRSDFSTFNAQLLEKLLYDEYELDRKTSFSNWISKMNELDFQKRTRSFFSELRKKHKIDEQSGPI